MFNFKKLFKLQMRPPSLILLITTSHDRWIFPSQSWEVRNSIIIVNNNNNNNNVQHKAQFLHIVQTEVSDHALSLTLYWFRPRGLFNVPHVFFSPGVATHFICF
jgi:hypothetical protein